MNGIEVKRRKIVFGEHEISRRKLTRESNSIDGMSRHLVTTGGIKKEVIDVGDPIDGPIYVIVEKEIGPEDMKLGSLFTPEQEASEKADWETFGKEMRECDNNYDKSNQ